ncbi:Autotransport protein domain-containing protein [Pandoravirus kuranda]|uniref:Autotransport protein domain-containing protein n=1 Tax=Pandoravirus kuranda TaxID=3019033 RepID=A0AA95J4A9_9VIRU|nr:Autotransport protein domain-containing protein [Pandoravirus kuranda]
MASALPTLAPTALLFVCLFVLPSTSLGATIEVCASGCAFTNIAAAATAASDTDTIAIHGGAYATAPSASITRRVTVWAVAPVSISGPGVWITIASPNVTTRGTFTLSDAGVVVAPNATWYQEGAFVIRHTALSAGYDSLGQPYGASSAIFVNSGTWVQNGALAITARTVGVEMSGTSARWDQRGTVEIDVPANGVAGDAHFGIVSGCDRALWNQTAPLTMRVGVGAGVRLGTAGITRWEQSGDVNITVTATQATGPVTAVALAVGPTGASVTWTQAGDAHLRLSASGVGALAEGVAMDANANRHNWTQEGGLYATVGVQSSALARVVRMGQQSTVWTQRGAVAVDGTTRSNGTLHAIVLGAGAWAGNVWEQSGAVDVSIDACVDGSLTPTVPSAAVRGTWRCGTWRSTGPVDVSLSTQSCIGAAAGAHPMWLDSRGCNFTLNRAVLMNGSASTVRCDTAPAPPTPATINGLPWGTPTQGTCPDLVLLPVVDLHWQDSDGLVVGWTRPVTLRAYATAAFVGQVPFAMASNIPLAANATAFVFAGSNASEPVTIRMVDRNGTPGANGTLALLPAAGVLLAEPRKTATFEILPWIESRNASGTPFTALVDTSSSTVVLVPREGIENMTFSFRALTETDTDGAVTRTLPLGSGAGRWAITTGSPLTQGAAQEYTMTIDTNDTTVDIVVALFDRRVEGVFDGGLLFSGDPALAKTSVRIRRWPRAEGQPVGRIELVLAFDDDNLTNATRSDEPVDNSTPIATTTYVLNSAGNTTADGRKTVRLSRDALVDGRLSTGSVESHIDAVQSAIVVVLPVFDQTLVYDPDLGVLFGTPSTDGDSGDRGASSLSSVSGQTLIIAVAASVGGAAVLVVFVVATIAGFAWYRQRRLAATVGPAVAFDPESAAPDQQL